MRLTFLATWALLGASFWAAGARGEPGPTPAAPSFIAGVALTPHYENPAERLTFDAMVDHVADLGATHLSVVVQWSQADVRASAIAPHPKETQDEVVVRRILRRARARGLQTMVLPILWIERRAEGEWRGTLQPTDRAAWWRSYRRFVLHFAALAEAEQASLFSVGSELASLETEAGRWRALIAEVRGRFSGRLTYSANWDHYQEVPFWDALDLVGLTGYHRLVPEPETVPEVPALAVVWTGVRNRLLRWRLGVGKPLIFTELGYPSLREAAHRPWDHTGDRPVDLEAQRRCLAAFAAVWREAPDLAGVFIWNAWGAGGPLDRGYTVRGKPAEAVVRDFFRARRQASDPNSERKLDR